MSGGVIPRAGRAHESTYQMTQAARDARMAKIRDGLLAKNPYLTEPELEKAIKLVLRAQMQALAKRRWSKQ
jgi:hypothetical protein